MDRGDEIIYSLSTDDLMVVANETIGRDLNLHEIEYLKSSIDSHINWYDVIENAIKDMLVEMGKRN
jgi:hypothetical protein